MTVATANDLSCPHYLPPTIGNPTILCPGCGSLIGDHRHAQNQANGMTAPTTLQRPEVRQQPRSAQRKG